MTTYLTVLGSGSWSSHGKQYRAGIHEVSEEIAEEARASGIRFLVITSQEPKITRGVDVGPLTLDDLKVGVGGVRIVPAEAEPLPDEEPRDPRGEYVCDWCTDDFPSKGALDRHVEFHHTLGVER